MKQVLPLALVGALVAAPALATEPTADEAPVTKGETELARLLEGREAGEPVRCLRRSQRDGLQIVDGTAMVFRDGSTLYVNRPGGAKFLDDWDLPVFRQFGSSLCERDQVELRDRFSHMPGPVLLLSEFVPYTKPEKEG